MIAQSVEKQNEMIHDIRHKYKKWKDSNYGAVNERIGKIRQKMDKRFVIPADGISEKFNSCLPPDYIKHMTYDQLKVFHNMVLNGNINFNEFNKLLVRNSVLK